MFALKKEIALHLTIMFTITWHVYNNTVSDILTNQTLVTNPSSNVIRVCRFLHDAVMWKLCSSFYAVSSRKFKLTESNISWYFRCVTIVNLNPCITLGTHLLCIQMGTVVRMQASFILFETVCPIYRNIISHQQFLKLFFSSQNVVNVINVYKCSVYNKFRRGSYVK